MAQNALSSNIYGSKFRAPKSQIRLLNTTDAKIDLSLNPASDPVNQMIVSNEWIIMIGDTGITQFFHIPTIKSTVSPLEADTIQSIISASPTRPKSENKENIRLRENITTGRLNTKPLSTQDKLDRSELRQVLVGFGEFPARYRLLIWRHLLKIPENESSFAALVERGRHPSCDDLGERYPLKSSRLFRALERTLSCVAQWNSLFGELDYIGKGHYYTMKYKNTFWASKVFLLKTFPVTMTSNDAVSIRENFPALANSLF